MVTPFLNISEQYDRTEYENIYSGAGPDDYDEYIASKMTHAVFLIHAHHYKYCYIYLSMHTRSTYYLDTTMSPRDTTFFYKGMFCLLLLYT